MPGHELGDFLIWMVSILCLKLFTEYKAHRHPPTPNKLKQQQIQIEKKKKKRKTSKIKGRKQPSSLLAHNSFWSSQALWFMMK